MSNQQAFLDTIATSEGVIGIGDDGYNVLVGSTPARPILFDSYADHPRIYSTRFKSTAAGRYQILARIYDAYKKPLMLTDFSPVAQDMIALRIIEECHALGDIDAGDIPAAIAKIAHIWASLPGSLYDQHTQPLDYLLAAYSKAGGTLNT